MNTNSKVTPMLIGNMLLDTETCLKYTCEVRLFFHHCLFQGCLLYSQSYVEPVLPCIIYTSGNSTMTVYYYTVLQMNGDEVELKKTEVDCVKCRSSFINIPGHCCPRCRMSISTVIHIAICSQQLFPQMQYLHFALFVFFSQCIILHMFTCFTHTTV